MNYELNFKINQYYNIIYLYKNKKFMTMWINL